MKPFDGITNAEVGCFVYILVAVVYVGAVPFTGCSKGRFRLQTPTTSWMSTADLPVNDSMLASCFRNFMLSMFPF